MGRINQIRRSTPVVAVAQQTKKVLRKGGVVTAGVRTQPDFLIIGTKRGGTTSAYKYFLEEHPAMLSTFPRPARVKGTYFFDENFSLGSQWYFSHFPLTSTTKFESKRRNHQVISGEASPYYLYHPLAAERAHALVPNTKIIALLRDPSERAFSNYKERRANDMEPLESFDEALDAEPERLKGEHDKILADPSYVSIAHRHNSYVDQGRYLPALERWWAAYGKENVLVEIAEDFYSDPQASFDRMCDHIGVFRHTLQNAKVFNAQASSPLPEDTKARLSEMFKQSNADLEDALGRKLDWH